MADPDPAFNFVSDAKLRDLLVDYYSEAKRSFAAEAQLGVLTACGAVLEGLLTWRLSQDPNALTAKGAPKKNGQSPPVEEWGLASLVAVAKELGAIGETSQSACWAVKEFRNFIHPYNTLRKGSARPTRSLAEGSLAAVQEVVRSLSGRLPR